MALEVPVSVSKDGTQIGIGVPHGFDSEYNYWSLIIGADAPKELKELLKFLTDEQYRNRDFKR